MTDEEKHKEQYPEHHKLQAVREQAQAVGSFMDWLADKRLVLAIRHEHTESCLDSRRRHNVCGSLVGELITASVTIRGLLAEFFEIDEDKIESEKRAMLDELRKGR